VAIQAHWYRYASSQSTTAAFSENRICGKERQTTFPPLGGEEATVFCFQFTTQHNFVRKVISKNPLEGRYNEMVI
jgi:hypothetical protein